MAGVKIVVEEKLGGQISFGGKEVRVLKATYEAVAEDKRAEFDEVLAKAQEVYQSKVADSKAKGERPQASKLKSEAIAEVVTPFLEANAVTKGTVKRSEPRVVRPTVTREEKKFRQAESSTDKEALKEEFDDFPTDLLDDSSEEVEVVEKDEFSDLEDELGLDDVLGEGEENVFSSPSRKDPFDAPEMDAFDDIDLDI